MAGRQARRLGRLSMEETGRCAQARQALLVPGGCWAAPPELPGTSTEPHLPEDPWPEEVDLKEPCGV